MIDGKLYKKADYETGFIIPGCQKLLDLPGEQHYLVHQSHIAATYRPCDAFEGLSKDMFDQCQAFIDLLAKHCGIDTDRHGLMGSRALRCALPMSDFDWAIYCRDPSSVKAFVTSDPRFTRELPFTMAHAYRKYASFTGLGQKGLTALFDDRWKYVRFKDLSMSITFVDPTLRADNLLGLGRIGKRVIVEATVSDYVGSYHSPRVVEVASGEKKHKILTWLFLYNGAFKEGDVVEVAGRTFEINNDTYILVEQPQDYIRNLTVERQW